MGRRLIRHYTCCYLYRLCWISGGWRLFVSCGLGLGSGCVCGLDGVDGVVFLVIFTFGWCYNLYYGFHRFAQIIHNIIIYNILHKINNETPKIKTKLPTTSPSKRRHRTPIIIINNLTLTLSTYWTCTKNITNTITINFTLRSL